MTNSRSLAPDNPLPAPPPPPLNILAPPPPPHPSHPQCKASVAQPVCEEFKVLGGPEDGWYYCQQLTCDWQQEYCDGNLQKDDDGVWSCLGNCKLRTASKGLPDSCTCTPASGVLPPDVDLADACFYGERASADMWSPEAGVALGPGIWISRAAFESKHDGVSLWASDYDLSSGGSRDDGYLTAKASFLSTNCPVPRPISISVPDPFHPGSTMIKAYYLNSCASCRKSDGAWADVA